MACGLMREWAFVRFGSTSWAPEVAEGARRLGVEAEEKGVVVNHDSVVFG